MLAIYLDAGHNVNGNPRRGWLIVDGSGNRVDFVDEGYAGRSALDEAGYGGIDDTIRIPTTPKFYREQSRRKGRR